MKAAIYREFQAPLSIESVPDPQAPVGGVVLEVQATGVCRSDWHGWMGHDPDIVLPHVPGHEMAGIVATVGAEVSKWKTGDRVTLPFVCGCGACPQCTAGNQQVCDRQFQPGFTHWGSYAQFVAIDYADTNLVRIPGDMSFVSAASLGCRFATSFRAVVAQGQVVPGQWVAVFGCGGVGLSAIMIAAALGARVIAIDIDDAILAFAESNGAEVTINASQQACASDAVRDLSDGGVQVSIDALGSAGTCFAAVSSLAKRGRHIQVGLLTDTEKHPPLPMDQVVANELEIIGSHGMQAWNYKHMFELIAEGILQPDRLVGRTVSLEAAVRKFSTEARFEGPGVTVIDRF